MPNSCICCGHTKRKTEKVSMFRFPADHSKRQQWITALNLTEDDINEESRICSKHFLNGDSANAPVLNLGSRFASPRKSDTERGKRAVKRASRSPISFVPAKRASTKSSSSRASSVSVTSDDQADQLSLSDSSAVMSSSGEQSIALAARVELLEAETKHLRLLVNKKPTSELVYFRVEQIDENDSLVRFFTGFASYKLFMIFFEFLGPSVYNLNYWGDKERKITVRRKK